MILFKFRLTSFTKYVDFIIGLYTLNCESITIFSIILLLSCNFLII